MAALVLDMPRFIRRGTSTAVTLPLYQPSGTVQSVTAATLSVIVAGVEVAAPTVTITSGVASATIGAGVTADLALGAGVLLRWVADGRAYDVLYHAAAAELACPITGATLTSYLPQFVGADRLLPSVAAAWRETVGQVASPWQVVELVGAEAAVKHLAAALLLEGAGLEYQQQAAQQRELAILAAGKIQIIRAEDDARVTPETPSLAAVRKAARWGMPRC